MSLSKIKKFALSKWNEVRQKSLGVKDKSEKSYPSNQNNRMRPKSIGVARRTRIDPFSL